MVVDFEHRKVIERQSAEQQQGADQERRGCEASLENCRHRNYGNILKVSKSLNVRVYLQGKNIFNIHIAVTVSPVREIVALLIRKLLPNSLAWAVGPTKSAFPCSGRTYAEGKKVSWKDGVRVIYAILKYNLRWRRS